MATQQTGLPPVSLPAGSFEGATLAQGFAAAADAKAEDRPDKFAAALDKARAGTDTGQRDPALLPDHVMVDIDNGHGGTERRQVYSPELADRHVAAETGNTGTVVETDDKAETARRKAIADAVKDSKPKKGDEAPAEEAESRTGAADPVLAEEALAAPPATAAAPDDTKTK